MQRNKPPASFWAYFEMGPWDGLVQLVSTHKIALGYMNRRGEMRRALYRCTPLNREGCGHPYRKPGDADYALPPIPVFALESDTPAPPAPVAEGIWAEEEAS